MRKIEITYIPSQWDWRASLKSITLEVAWVIGALVIAASLILGFLTLLTYITGWAILAGA